MTMTPRLSKFVLTSHITFSVGWLGAVAVFLALAITGVTSQNIQIARSAYLSMELSGWYVIVPFCFASLLTGVVLTLGTKWGLIKHYWIVVKLILTIVTSIALLLHMKPISYLSILAASTTLSNNEQPGLRVQLIADAGAALLVLLAITTISVYKPWGRIPYGLLNNKGQNIQMQGVVSSLKNSWKLYLLIGIICLLVLFIIQHLVGGGMGHY